MIILHGSGAGVTDVLGKTFPDNDWVDLRQKAVRLLSARGHEDAASILTEIPFELREGTNYFGDEFSLLFAKLDLDTYIQVEEERTASRVSFRLIAETISEIGPFTRFIIVELETAERPSPVTPPSPQVTSRAVEIALSDAEQLIRTNGPVSAVDRAHTALHGYLRVVLDRAGIPYAEKASITKLYKILRNEHPDLCEIGGRSEEVWRIVSSMASAVDAINILRNNASVAHPNPVLLEEPEAMLAINSARTLLHYLDARVE